jgi:uncharacterized protein YcnI
VKRPLAGVVLALVLVPAAAAHVSVSPTLVDPGSSRLYTFTLPNDEGRSAITGLVVALPPGSEAQQAEAVSGWHATLTPSSVSWRGGRIPGGQFATFVLRAVAPERPGSILFVARESFADGTRLVVPNDVVVAPADSSVAASPQDKGARTLGNAALGVALAAALLALLGGFVSLSVWLRKD